ncbi:GNAT family N-acetyltransferase [Flavihumibacter sp. RY-1]|uniref:GNAT family N-acetyltransferase n=1 Tax=Flavihumibacter fluminis TaxID=2909236 RepID=A0ABS9BFA9_9BACT|nr:GNAT family N-acetyltransferase [Flavihumibacter fluminis]MCF1714402.1 GNAT family N-acetyltransferase [Flavihumibacter fluminis]
MKQALYKDKILIVNILVHSFADNKSIKYIVKQDSRKEERLRKLMAYSFERCYRFGEVYLTEDKKACALILFPHKKKTSLSALLLDLDLAFSVIGLSNLKKVLSRESKIKQLYPKSPFYYLWFIGVYPADQNKGIGKTLLNEILTNAEREGLPVYLETSTRKNITWYEQFGFVTYNKLDFGYELFCMRRD